MKYLGILLIGGWLFFSCQNENIKKEDVNIENQWNGVNENTKLQYLSIVDSFTKYKGSNLEKSRIFVDSMVELSKSIGHIKYLSALTNKGTYFYIAQKNDSAQIFLDSVIQDSLAIVNPEYAHLAKLTLSQMMMNQGQLDEARTLLNQMESDDYSFKDKLFSVYLFKSILGSHEKNKENEINYLLKADSVGTVDLRQNFNLYYNLGGTYFNTSDYSKALVFFKKSIPYIDSLEINRFYPVLYNLIATTYGELDSLPLMKEYLDLALEKSIYNSKEKGVVYYYLGTYYLRKKDFSNAQVSNDIALDELKKSNYKFYLLHAINQAIFIKNKLKDTSSSEDLIKEAYSECNIFMSELDSLTFDEYTIRDKFRTKLPQVDYQFLVEFFDRKTVYEEKRTNDKVAELLKQYEAEKKDAEIKLHLQKEKLTVEKLHRNNIILFAISILSLLLLVLFILNKKTIRKEQLINLFLLEKHNQLMAQNKVLSRRENAISNRNKKKVGEIVNDFVVLTDKNSTKISLEEIVFLEATEKQVKIVTEKEAIFDWQSLKSFGQILPSDSFIQIHRSFIVNKSHIKCFRKNMVTMSDGNQIKVTKTYIDNLMNG